jgi:hypothetical protein
VNIAWQSSERFVDVWGGLWLADYLGAFLTAGGTGSYFFHYLPWALSDDCPKQWGTFALHQVAPGFRLQRLAQYYASQLLTQTWVTPGDGVHRVFPARTDVVDGVDHTLVTAYAVNLPDGRWSLLLVNKDRAEAHTVGVSFDDAAARRSFAFSGDVSVTSWGADQYVWRPNANGGEARPADPPRVTSQRSGPFTLPRSSITILRGRVAPVR